MLGAGDNKVVASERLQQKEFPTYRNFFKFMTDDTTLIQSQKPENKGIHPLTKICSKPLWKFRNKKRKNAASSLHRRLVCVRLATETANTMRFRKYEHRLPQALKKFYYKNTCLFSTTLCPLESSPMDSLTCCMF